MLAFPTLDRSLLKSRLPRRLILHEKRHLQIHFEDLQLLFQSCLAFLSVDFREFLESLDNAGLIGVVPFEEQPAKVRMFDKISAAELFEIYRRSVGGNATFLLNVPPAASVSVASCVLSPTAAGPDVSFDPTT